VGFAFTAGRRQRGFTLLDSVIVIVILGIIGMIIIPEFQGVIQETRLSEAAAEIVSGLQYAGNLAVLYRRPFGFRAPATGTSRRFEIFDNRDTTVCTDQVPDNPPMNAECVVLNPLDKNWYIRDFAEMENYRAFTFDIKRDDDDALIQSIVFYPDGHSDSSDITVTVDLSGRLKRIKVDGTTGRIRTE
jgi:Tfp pilus assembly protein FimT